MSAFLARSREQTDGALAVAICTTRGPTQHYTHGLYMRHRNVSSDETMESLTFTQVVF